LDLLESGAFQRDWGVLCIYINMFGSKACLTATLTIQMRPSFSSLAESPRVHNYFSIIGPKKTTS
jgi:hypothetical protein